MTLMIKAFAIWLLIVGLLVWVNPVQAANTAERPEYKLATEGSRIVTIKEFRSKLDPTMICVTAVYGHYQSVSISCMREK